MTEPDDQRIEEINSISLKRIDTDDEDAYQLWKSQADYAEKSLFEYQAILVAAHAWSQRTAGDEHFDMMDAFRDGVLWTLYQPVTEDEALAATARLEDTPLGDTDPVVRIITALNQVRRYGDDGSDEPSDLLVEAAIDAHKRYNHHALKVSQFLTGVKWVCEQNPDLHETRALTPLYKSWSDKATLTQLFGKLGTALQEHRRPKGKEW